MAIRVTVGDADADADENDDDKATAVMMLCRSMHLPLRDISYGNV